MSELEKDILLAMSCPWGREAREVADYLEKLGYTRTGLTETQREAVERATKAFENVDMFYDAQILRDAFSISSLAPPEPRHPERKVVQIAAIPGDLSRDIYPEIAQLCDDGTVWVIMRGDDKHYRIPPIPGDDA